MNSSEIPGAVLVWVSEKEPAESAIVELESLVTTLGYEVRAVISQRRPRPDKAYYVGTGKLEEVKSVANATDSSIIGELYFQVQHFDKKKSSYKNRCIM